MAEITITLRDSEDGNGIDAHSRFDPELPQDTENLTGAQSTALYMLTSAFPPDKEGINWNTDTVDNKNE